MDEGVTTLEAKTGYGLDAENELKMIRVMELLERDLPLDIEKTFLGAHALPPEFSGRFTEYVRMVIDEMLPAAADRVDAVDVFCENIAFDLELTGKVFEAALGLGLAVKIHAEQLSNMGAARLAASMGALSADHLEYLDESGVRAMASAGTTAVLLPGAFYYLRANRLPPVELLRRHRVPVAVATDCNPGSSPCVSILTVLNMACTLFRLSPEEALAGVTANAARALGIQHRVGTIEPGKRADLVLWDVEQPAELAYYMGYNPCRMVIKNGIVVSEDGKMSEAGRASVWPTPWAKRVRGTSISGP
jgi:imidazolonepropionase